MGKKVPATNFSRSWMRVDETDDPSFYAGMLEATRAQAVEAARRDPATAFGALGLRPGLRLLDVGCGLGDYLRVMAPLVAPGAAVGIDLSTELVGRAQALASPGPGNLAFRASDVYDMPFPHASFDRVTAMQVMLHLSDPWRALEEVRRVLAPGGKVLISEWDWDSTCLAVTDRDLGRRFTHLLCDQMRNGLIVRDLPHWLTGHGFVDVEVAAQAQVSREPGAAYQRLIEPATGELVRMGALSENDGFRLLEDLRDRTATGRYFLARTNYLTVATAG